MLSKTLNQFRTIAPATQRTMASAATLDDAPKRVLISGAAGQIAYSIVFRIARYVSLTLSLRPKYLVTHLSFSF